jgi:flagellar hook assembly protein FlgD
LVDVDFNGQKTEHGPIRVSSDMVSDNSSISNSFILHPAYPNPFNPSTTIRFELLSSMQVCTDVEFSIHNTQGHLVKTLYRGQLPHGIHELQWNGDSDNEAVAASGMYYGVLKIGNSVKTIKMLLIK